jgi:hypothetical protein
VQDAVLDPHRDAAGDGIDMPEQDDMEITLTDSADRVANLVLGHRETALPHLLLEEGDGGVFTR